VAETAIGLPLLPLAGPETAVTDRSTAMLLITMALPAFALLASLPSSIRLAGSTTAPTK
jgi:hypothetical protein